MTSGRGNAEERSGAVRWPEWRWLRLTSSSTFNGRRHLLRDDSCVERFNAVWGLTGVDNEAIPLHSSNPPRRVQYPILGVARVYDEGVSPKRSERNVGSDTSDDRNVAADVSVGRVIVSAGIQSDRLPMRPRRRTNPGWPKSV